MEDFSENWFKIIGDYNLSSKQHVADVKIETVLETNKGSVRIHEIDCAIRHLETFNATGLSLKHFDHDQKEHIALHPNIDDNEKFGYTAFALKQSISSSIVSYHDSQTANESKQKDVYKERSNREFGPHSNLDDAKESENTYFVLATDGESFIISRRANVQKIDKVNHYESRIKS